MVNFFDINRIATAAVGALVLSTACIGAAIGPARALEGDATLQMAASDGAAAGAVSA